MVTAIEFLSRFKQLIHKGERVEPIAWLGLVSGIFRWLPGSDALGVAAFRSSDLNGQFMCAEVSAHERKHKQ
jgi:hypothetical protein